jgi:hypothetical protein
VLEAMLLLSLGTGLQRWLPMPRWAFLRGSAREVPEGWGHDPVGTLPVQAATPVERQVAVAAHRASSRLPGEPSCLAEALAAQLMLRRRGEPGVVVIGLRRRAVDGPGERCDAHAWLLGREGALIGAGAARGYTPATLYAVGRDGPHARGRFS